MDKFSMILPIIIAVEAGLAGVIHTIAGNAGSAIYWFSACTIILGVILIPELG